MVVFVQEGLTALMLATQRGHAEVVQALLDAKADPNITESVSIYSYYVASDLQYFHIDCRLECTFFRSKIWISTDYQTSD